MVIRVVVELPLNVPSLHFRLNILAFPLFAIGKSTFHEDKSHFRLPGNHFFIMEPES